MACMSAIISFAHRRIQLAACVGAGVGNGPARLIMRADINGIAVALYARPGYRRYPR